MNSIELVQLQGSLVILSQMYKSLSKGRIDKVAMAQSSLDIESSYDVAEMNNVFEQVRRQLANRYDLKDTQATIEWLDDKKGLKLIADHKMHLEAIIEIVLQTAGRRALSPKVFDLSEQPQEANLKVSQNIRFRQGIKSEDCKKISTILRQALPKLKVQIQGDTLRLTSSSKNQLQEAMTIMKEQSFEFPINFTNFR